MHSPDPQPGASDPQPQAPQLLARESELPDGWSSDEYELIDFGSGRKLERFGAFILDRPSPAAEAEVQSSPHAWSSAQARVGTDGQVELSGTGDMESQVAAWQVRYGQLAFNLKLTPFGHVGLFPEQAANWRWLNNTLRTLSPHASAPSASSASTAPLSQPTQSPRTFQVAQPASAPATALNLFAYTGGTTQALAQAGASVVHVDASAPAVAWARHNAASSGLQDHPIRWLVEDARKFTQRELRRGKRYDAIVLDPPSYGHGPTGKPWILSEHLPELVENCLALLRHNGNSWLLFTAHCEYPTPYQISESLSHMHQPKSLTDGRLQLLDRHQRPLDAGFYIRAQY